MFTDAECFMFFELTSAHAKNNRTVRDYEARLYESIEIGNKNYRIANNLQNKLKEKELVEKSQNKEIEDLKSQIEKYKNMTNLASVKIDELEKRTAVYESVLPQKDVCIVHEKSKEYVEKKLAEKGILHNKSLEYCLNFTKNKPVAYQ